MRLLPAALLGIGLLCSLLPINAIAGWDEGVAAYVKKDYAKALREFEPLAIKGNAKSQLFLGGRYLKGQAVVQSDKDAAKWFLLAANQGNAEAQYFIGLMYFHGDGVGQDAKEAGKWLRLSANQGNTDAKKNLVKFEEREREQIAASIRIEEEAKRKAEEEKRREEDAKQREEEVKRIEEARRIEEEAQRKAEEARRIEEEAKRKAERRASTIFWIALVCGIAVFGTIIFRKRKQLLANPKAMIWAISLPLLAGGGYGVSQWMEKLRAEAEIERRHFGFDKLKDIEDRWTDGYKVAEATGRIALSGPVQNLQAIRRDLKGTKVSECLAPAKAQLEQILDLTVDSFVGVMAQENFIQEFTASTKMIQARAQFVSYRRDRDLCDK